MGRPNKGGLFHTNKKLADGTVVTYWYAYRGGPRIEAPPGTREFGEAIKAAKAEPRPAPKPVTIDLQKVIDEYLDSEEFLGVRPRTQADYRKLAKVVVADFARLPVAALHENPEDVRGDFLAWRDRLAKGINGHGSRRQADYAWTFLNLILNWGRKRGRIKLNPCRDMGIKRVYTKTRRDNVWTQDQIDDFIRVASPEITLALMLALYTGQRQGDLLRMTWAQYDGRVIRVRQGKTGEPIHVPVARALKELLDATPRRSPLILVNQDGVPWEPKGNGFRVMIGKTKKKARIAGVTFHDLRGTSVTRLALAGSTEPEIASLTGHSTSQVRSILDANYLHRDVRLAENAIAKLNAYENVFQTASQPIDISSARKARFEKNSQ